MNWAGIDWDQPWFRPYQMVGQQVSQRLARGTTVAQALDQVLQLHGRPILAAGPLHFVSADHLPKGCPYESFIATTAHIPTRDNWHDFFNGLVWLRWPELKSHLHHIQATEIHHQGISGKRGAVRDAVTLFDENGALFSGPEILGHLWRQRDWQALFCTHRDLWQQAQVVIIGHALLQRLLQPRKALCAHTWVQHVPYGSVWFKALSATDWARKPFQPLPVLGIPDWWQPNQETIFYADTTVFRPSKISGQVGKKPSIDK